MAAKSSTRGVRGAAVVLTACLGLLLTGCQPLEKTEPGPPEFRNDGTRTALSAEFAQKLSIGELALPSRNAVALNPKLAPFNAKGDGVTDDTIAVQMWLNAGGIRLANGTYRIVKGLTLAGNDRHFYTANAKILADGPNITALTVTGKKADIRAYIDGNNRAAFGLKVTGAAAAVENGRYENFRSATQSARAIDATTTGGIIVRNNVVRNVVSVGDKTRGNGPGFSRGIGLNARTAATANSVISGNRIENITGEEGDAIHVLFYDGTYPFKSGKVSISDNQIRNVSRRFIKVQASNVVVERNTLNFDLARPPANPGPAIDIIRSEYANVIGNKINPNLIGTGITVSGVSATRLRGIDIRDNILRQKDAKTAVNIHVMWATSPKVRNNRIYGGGAGVLIRSSTNALVQGNIRYPGIR
ncbi:right-handed parallel beta-helix repeat-containing protein [Arthrobacter sp. ok362]|uniref:right-handed parallel beta-helix repeat-containing protein n=1 Tax=Arthrobacter sp. ok362 TaxID=1761745 RepID=UPI000885FD7B|nr:right-handed parallel beta-helix repeat-containing protein [Arthrobacter sp. ok362]SDL96824.1 hypothetical protein SAMN04487913_11913 [Arthrobacter sp. ok362]